MAVRWPQYMLCRGTIGMADFCWECTEEHFGQKYASKNDFANLISKEEFEKDVVAHVLCEGCGFIEVNHLGKR